MNEYKTIFLAHEKITFLIKTRNNWYVHTSPKRIIKITFMSCSTSKINAEEMIAYVCELHEKDIKGKDCNMDFSRKRSSIYFKKKM